MDTEATATTVTPLLHATEPARQKLGGISRSTLYLLIQRGELETVKIGRRTFIPETSLQEFVSKLGVR